jgi:hypothetical protein
MRTADLAKLRRMSMACQTGRFEFTKYNSIIKKPHADEATIEDLYVVDPGGGVKVTLGSALEALTSLSIWSFYGLMIATLWAIKTYIFAS